jgi:hypothetical protein
MPWRWEPPIMHTSRIALKSGWFCYACKWVPGCTGKNALKSQQLCIACKLHLAVTSRLVMTSRHISHATEVYLGQTSRIALKSGWFCYACKWVPGCTGGNALKSWQLCVTCKPYFAVTSRFPMTSRHISCATEVYLGQTSRITLKSGWFCYACKWVPGCTGKNALKAQQLCIACKPHLAFTSRSAMTSSHVCYVTEVYLGHMSRITMKSGLIWDPCKGIPGAPTESSWSQGDSTMPANEYLGADAVKSWQFCLACKPSLAVTNRITMKSGSIWDVFKGVPGTNHKVAFTSRCICNAQQGTWDTQAKSAWSHDDSARCTCAIPLKSCYIWYACNSISVLTSHQICHDWAPVALHDYGHFGLKSWHSLLLTLTWWYEKLYLFKRLFTCNERS